MFKNQHVNRWRWRLRSLVAHWSFRPVIPCFVNVKRQRKRHLQATVVIDSLPTEK